MFVTIPMYRTAHKHWYVGGKGNICKDVDNIPGNRPHEVCVYCLVVSFCLLSFNVCNEAPLITIGLFQVKKIYCWCIRRMEIRWNILLQYDQYCLISDNGFMKRRAIAVMFGNSSNVCISHPMALNISKRGSRCTCDVGSEVLIQYIEY